jgi:hypothetical protein
MTAPTANSPGPEAALLTRRARFPEHVVRQSFAEETVVLNLETGRYHGLHGSGGRMIDALATADSIGAAAAAIAAHYGMSSDRVEADLLGFCDELVERGLMEIDDLAR